MESDQNYNKMLSSVCPMNAIIILVGKGRKEDKMWSPGS